MFQKRLNKRIIETMKKHTKSDRISIEEFKRLIDNLNHSNKKTDSKIRIGLILQYFTGLRFSDLEKFTYHDVLNLSKLHIKETKTSKPKTVEISPLLKEEVKKYVDANKVDLNGSVLSHSIQYANRKLKQYKYLYNIKNYANDSDYKLSTHSIRKLALYDIYKKSGINVSLKISNHANIETHLDYICANEDITNGYLNRSW